jgi:hypothetical protein
MEDVEEEDGEEMEEDLVSVAALLDSISHLL